MQQTIDHTTLRASLESALESPRALGRLRAYFDLRAQLEEIEGQIVADAIRERGTTWRQLGHVADVPWQTLYRRWSHVQRTDRRG